MGLAVSKGNPFILNDYEEQYISMYKRLEELYEEAKKLDKYVDIRMSFYLTEMTYKGKKSTFKYTKLSYDELLKKIAKKIKDGDEPKKTKGFGNMEKRFKVAMDIMKNGGTCIEDDDTLTVSNSNQKVVFDDLSIQKKYMGEFFTSGIEAIKTCVPKNKVSKSSSKKSLSLDEQNKRMEELLREKGLKI